MLVYQQCIHIIKCNARMEKNRAHSSHGIQHSWSFLAFTFRNETVFEMIATFIIKVFSQNVKTVIFKLKISFVSVCVHFHSFNSHLLDSLFNLKILWFRYLKEKLKISIPFFSLNSIRAAVWVQREKQRKQVWNCQQLSRQVRANKNLRDLSNCRRHSHYLTGNHWSLCKLERFKFSCNFLY